MKQERDRVWTSPPFHCDASATIGPWEDGKAES